MKRFSFWILFLSLLSLIGCGAELVATQGAVAEQKKKEAEQAEKQVEDVERRLNETMEDVEAREQEIEEAGK